jgi:hypothetical protein
MAPWNITNNALAFGGGFDVLGDYGWPLFLFAAPLGIIFSWKNKTARAIAFYVAAHFLVWFMTKPVLRFLVGLLPAATLFAAVGFKGLIYDRGKFARWASAFLAVPFLLSNLFMFFLISDGFKAFDVPLGLSDRETFLNHRLAFYGVYEEANRSLGPNDRLLLVGEQRTYHLKVPFICANLFASSPVSNLANTTNSLDFFRNGIAEMGITHILVHERELERLGGLEKFGFTSDGKHTFSSFLTQNCLVLSSQNGVSLYKISR